MPVSFVANRVTLLQTDNDNDGYADAGDVLRHTLTFTNTGDTNATGVTINDLLGGSTETGLVNISPIAFNDSFTAVGNTLLEVGNATTQTGPQSGVSGNILSNDVGSTTIGIGALAGDDVTGFTISKLQGTDVVGAGPVTATSQFGGTVTLITSGADAGSFTYISNDGFQGTDTFNYTIRDAGINGIAGDGDDTTSIGTVSITVTGQVWYIDSAAAPGGDGTSTNPFASITALNTANVDGTGDYIYVQGNAAGSLVLEQSEHLIGQGALLNVAGFDIAAAGSRSTITGSSGFTVTLAGLGTGNNEIAGINIVSTGGAANHGLTGTSFGNLTLNNTTIDASGQALVLSTGAIVAGSTGLVSTDSDGGTNNVSLTSISGTLSLGSGALSGATGTAFNVSGGSVQAAYGGNISQASASQALVSVTGGHSGTLTFSTGTLSATNGTGLQFDNADGTYNFNGTNTLNGGDAGVDIVNGSGGGFSFSTNSSITNPTGIAFNVNGGTGNIDYNGTITHTNNAQTIAVQNHTGGTVSFDGTVSSTGNADGINLAGNAGATINLTNTLTINTSTSGTTGFSATGGGTVNVSHSGNTINSGGGTGVNINNTNVNFTGGSLDIDTAGGVGFTASGGGTITVTGSNNSITSTSATALSVNGTTIGAAGLTFHDISSGNNSAAADPVNGIVLANTGSTAGLSVTGDGGGANNGSGGTIQHTTGDGISLTNTMDLHLGYMNITGNLGDGIGGSGVNGLVLNRLNVTLNGDDAAFDESGINISELTGTSSGGLHPTSISNSVFTNNEEFQVQIINTTGTLTAFQFTNNTVTSDGSSGTIGNLVNFLGLGTANMAITATGGTYTGNAPLTATGLNIDHSGTSGTMTATVNGGTFTNNNVAVTMSVAQGANLDFDIIGTTSTGNRSHGLNLFVAASSTGTVTGSFLNNIIGTAGVLNSGSSVGFGVRVQNEGSTATANPVTVLISGNTIRELESFAAININQGIAGQALSRTTNATIINNTISDVHNSRAIVVQQNNSTNATSAGTTNLDIHGNILSLATIAGNVGDHTVIRIRQLDANGGDVNIVQTQATAAATATELDDANGFNNSGLVSISGSVDYGQPAPPLPLLLVGNDGQLYLWELDSRNFGTPTWAPADNGSQGGDGGGDPPAPAADPGPVVVDDGVLSQAELALIVDAAIARWAAAGASAEELAAMRAVTFTVEDLAGRFLGSSSAGQVALDTDAAGARWFIDATPGDDSEFFDDGSDLYGFSAGAADHVDLLTVVMHELGHQIGLADTYAPGDDGQLMDGTISAGERRLPGADEVAQATGTATAGELALTPVSIGTVPAGRAVTIQWDSTVDLFLNQIVPTFNNTSSVSGSNFVTTTSNTQVLGPNGVPSMSNVVLDSLTLGNLIFFDVNNNGTFDGGDTGINGVALTLFADTNANGVFDSGIDVQLGTTTSAGGGLYSFANLAPGDYIVRVDAANFTGGGALVGRLTATGAADPDNNDDTDDNGANAAGGIVVSQAITLAQNGETTNDATGHADINNTLDFGFIQLNQPPVNTVPGTQTINEDATLTFNGGMAISVNDPDVGAGNLTVTISVVNGQLTLSTIMGLSFAMGGGDGTDDTSMTFSGTQAAINAALTNLLYETTLDYNGSDTLTLVTNDNGNTGADPGTSGGPGDEQDTDTVTINITAVADIANDTMSFNEDSGTHTLTMPNNDTFENPGRSITAVTQGLHGFVSINDANTSGDTTDDYVVYTQAADYNGADSFTYTVTSGGVTETATVNVSIAAVADAADDSPTVAEDSGTTTINVIANDSFENGGFSITSVTQGLHGTVTIIDGPDADMNPDYVTYTPTADYYGSDSFTYTVTSGGVTEVATVNVNVTALADIADDSVTVIADSGVNALNLIANDTFENAGRAITAVGAALHGTTAIDTHGDADPTNDTVTYSPTGGYTGPDSFTYTVTSGGATEIATVTVNVQPANASPVVDLDTGDPGIDDTNLFVENGTASGIGTTISVTDAEGDNIVSATVTITDPEAGDLLSVTLPLPPGITVDLLNSTATTLILIGSASAATYAGALGQVGYENTTDDPTDGGTNTNRLITVTVNDGTSNSNPAAVMTMSIAASNDPTVITGDTTGDVTEAGGVANGTLGDPTDDGDIDSSDPDGPDDSWVTVSAGTSSASGYGTYELAADGSWVYTLDDSDPAVQALNGAGTLTDTFTAMTAQGDAQVVTITIHAQNDTPTITGDTTGDVTEAGGINNGTAGTPTDTGDLNAADVDNTNDGWQAVAAGGATANGYGTYALSAAGVWVYTLNDNNAAVQALTGAATLVDTFNALTEDGTSQTVTITIHGQEDQADAINDAVTTDEATAVSGSVFVNNGSGADNDPDGPPGFVVTAVNGVGASVGVQITLGTGALLRLNANGTFTYDPNHAFDTTPAPGSGAANTPAPDSFTYTISGGDTATVNISVTGIDTNDNLVGTAGVDTMNGGAGNDVVGGGAGNDMLFGGVGNDNLLGGDNDDSLDGGDNDDFLDGGTGMDALIGGNGVDLLFGGDGNDNLLGGTGNDYLNGGIGGDFADGGTGNDAIDGGTGNDILFGGDNDDNLLGGDGNDYLNGGLGVDFADGGIGNDAFEGGAGNDIAFGGNDNDNLLGQDGDDYLNGGAGLDYAEGGIGNDYLDGGAGVDILLGGADNDTIIAGDGDDHAEGGDGADLMFGGNNNDELIGGIGNDYLDGGDGLDYLDGGADNDGLAGGLGNDTMAGGAGADTFHFATALGATNIDTILDFAAGVDTIALRDTVFHLGVGGLDPGAFLVGSSASSDSTRIIYDPTTGALYFDSDGGGGTAQVQFATLSTGLDLHASDFVVF